MAYGTIKVDNITFDNGGVDKLITVSGLFYSTSGALTVTGAISGGSVTAPTATFTTLTGTTTAGTTATFTSGSFTSLTGVTTTVTSGVFGLGSAAAPSIAFSGDPNTGIYSPGADQVGISTGGTGRVFVDSSGNVGISDSSPSTNTIGAGAPTVVLRGTSGAQPTRSAGLCFISQDGTSKTFQYHDNGIFCTQSTTATAQVWFTNNLERMRIDSSGNVGIGVVPSTWGSPQKSIELAGGSSISFNTGAPQVYLNSNCYYNGTNWIYKTTGLVNQFVENPAGGGFIWNNAPSGTAGAAISFTQAMTLDASGRLGIGISNPTQLCEVRNASAATQTLVGIGDSNLARMLVGYTPSGSPSSSDASAITVDNSGNITLSTRSSVANVIAFRTSTGAGAATERMRIDSVGKVGIGATPLYPLHVEKNQEDLLALVNTGVSTYRFQVKTDASLAVVQNSTERARIDSSGRLLVGTYSASVTCRAVFQGHQADNTASTDVYFQNGTAAASVLSGNALGTLSFAASGSRGAYITTVADANWTASSFPAHIQFATVASGSTSPTERLRITNDGVMCHDQPTPATYAAAATLTVADLKTGIITYTGGAATLTLPTGTLTEGGFAGIYTNMTFEWSVINTGAGICTIGAGTAHTIVGSGSVAIGASARFTSRRTAANTFISYRLS